jgi:Mrp family chromosome partitioning ATPase
VDYLTEPWLFLSCRLASANCGSAAARHRGRQTPGIRCARASNALVAGGACGGLAVTRKVAVASQKGGVGKTATLLGLTSAIVARGGQVLAVDVDQQGNLTTGLGVEVEPGQPHHLRLVEPDEGRRRGRRGHRLTVGGR